MGFFKCLAYVAGGVGAVVLAPMTGGSSIALAVGAMGTTTAAGAVIGAGIGATAAAIDHAAASKSTAYNRGVSEGAKAGEYVAAAKYKNQVDEFAQQLGEYHDRDAKIVALYAVGLSIANADGIICGKEKDELDTFVNGCMAGSLPPPVKETISQMARKAPPLEKALELAKNANLSKQDINNVINLVANADGRMSPSEAAFIKNWEKLSQQYNFG